MIGNINSFNSKRSTTICFEWKVYFIWDTLMKDTPFSLNHAPGEQSVILGKACSEKKNKYLRNHYTHRTDNVPINFIHVTTYSKSIRLYYIESFVPCFKNKKRITKKTFPWNWCEIQVHILQKLYVVCLKSVEQFGTHFDSFTWIFKVRYSVLLFRS